MIFLSPPYQSGKELEYVKQAFESNYIAPAGEFIERFEERICQVSGSKYAVAVSSGTAAIHLALRALGIRDGDFVLASTFTFIGSVAPVIYQNAVPIFIDSDYKSWNMDPNLLEDAIKELKKRNIKPKALILTHLYGQPADVESIAKICDENGIFLIEDAAESLGATFKGKHTGRFGICGIYSFNGNKIITTSGGGMLITDDERISQKVRFLANQAKEDTPWYEHREIGYNYRMSNISAAIGVAQIETLEFRVKKRRTIFEYYKKELSDMGEFMPELEGARGNRWLTTLTLKDIEPLKVMESLKKHDIEARPLWKPMHLQPVFKGCQAFTSGVSENLFRKGICLPSGTELTEKELSHICGIVRSQI